MINIIGRRKIFITLSSALVAASIVSMAVFGLKQGIDFVGGTLWHVEFQKEVTSADLSPFLKEVTGSNEIVITKEAGANSFLIRLPEITEEQHQSYLGEIKKKYNDIEELRFESIGPVVGNELRQNSLWAFFLVLAAISLYIAFVFRKVSFPVRSWKYGVITLVTLFHDAIIPIGITAVYGYYQNVEVGVGLVVAVLVIIGFSVHDTIVVLDRTRENLRMAGGMVSDFAGVVNKSVNQTLARSINTSLTLVIVSAALYWFGPESLSYFNLMILIGVIIGTYSSICVASSLLVVWQKDRG